MIFRSRANLAPAVRARQHPERVGRSAVPEVDLDELALALKSFVHDPVY